MRAGRALTGFATAVGAAGLLAAAGARRPVVRRWPFSVAQMITCLPASEAPERLAIVHLGAGLLAVATRGRGALPAVFLNGLALAAQADLRRDAARSAAVLDAALDGLPSVNRRPAGRTGRRSRRDRYRRSTDVAYGSDPAHRLDVWARPGLPPDAAAPVLVQVHGGAWTRGDKRGQAEPLLAHMAERGWVGVAVNYRLGPAQRWPSMIVDVKRALAWVRHGIAEHGGDPGFVVITGGSAGAHLAALAALSADDPAYQPGFADADTSVAAAVPMYGVHDFTVDENGLFALLAGKVFGTAAGDRSWRAASPVHRARPDAPPFLMVHGDTDTVAGVDQSRRLVTALRAAGAPVRYAELPRAQHGFDAFPTRRTRVVVAAVDRFLTAVHRRHLGRSGPPRDPSGQELDGTGESAPASSS